MTHLKILGLYVVLLVGFGAGMAEWAERSLAADAQRMADLRFQRMRAELLYGGGELNPELFDVLEASK